MRIHPEDLTAYFPHLEWIIHEPCVSAALGGYVCAEATIQSTEEYGGGYITVIAYEDGQVSAEFRAAARDDFGCASFPRSGQTVQDAMQSLREQMEWRTRLLQKVLGLG